MLDTSCRTGLFKEECRFMCRWTTSNKDKTTPDNYKRVTHVHSGLE